MENEKEIIPQNDGSFIFRETIPEQVIPEKVVETKFNLEEAYKELEKLDADITDTKKEIEQQNQHLAEIEGVKNNLQEKITRVETLSD